MGLFNRDPKPLLDDGRPRCQELVHEVGSRFGFHQCMFHGKNAEEGKTWCQHHTPSVIKAKREEQQQKWERKWERERKAHARKQRAVAVYAILERELGKDFTDDDLLPLLRRGDS